METWMMLLVGGVFFGGLFVYLMFMIFLPEWVGITGKKAREAQDAHRGVQASGPDLLGRMQGEGQNKDKHKDKHNGEDKS
jgi:hypothetical protein